MKFINKYDSLIENDNKEIEIYIKDSKYKQYVFQENRNNIVKMQLILERNHLRNKKNKEEEYWKILTIFYATFILS